MSIKLQKLNVVKEVDSEEKAKKLEDIGFKRMKIDQYEEGDSDGSGSVGADNSGGDGRPQTTGKRK